MIGDAAPFTPEPIIERFLHVPEQFWWGADYYRAALPATGSWIVWDKRIKTNVEYGFGSQFELCWSRKAHKRMVVTVPWSGVIGLNQAWVDNKRYHPAQKPVKLVQWFLEHYAARNGTVLDLYAGAGSTLLASQLFGCRALCMEIVPDYCDIIIERYNRLTA